MKKIKAILIDDEEAAREVLSNLLIRFCPEVEIIADAHNLTVGVKKIKDLNPDVVFLDIQMPNYAGYEIVNFFDIINFNIVFVTAYDQFAIKAFDISALDYILKPINVDRLKLAINKLDKRQREKVTQEQYKLLNETISQQKPSRLTITDKGFNSFIQIEDIIAIEGESAYSKIHLLDGSEHLLSRNLKKTTELLDGWTCFFRSHKSWLINLNYIEKYSKSSAEIIMKNNLKTKLSRYKVAAFNEVTSG